MWRILLLLGALILFTLLIIEFPHTFYDRDTRYRALYLLMLLMGMVAMRRSPHWQKAPVLRYALIWVTILFALIFSYSFKDVLQNSKLVGTLFPSHIQITSDNSMQIHATNEGNFFIEGKVNHVPVLFMIDTGSSDIVLSPDDATRVGLSPQTLDYSRGYATANGFGVGAPVTLGILSIGAITLYDVPASINKAEMKESLLGMSFLHHLKSFRFQGDTLTLTP